MVRRAAVGGEARVYDVSGRRVAPLEASLSVGARATAAQKRARRKLELQNSDTDLIQDFEFPTVANIIKTTPDGRYLFASGVYPPQIHVYDTEELSLKFKRHVDSEIVQFQILESDWNKFALLRMDRYVDLHSAFGSHFKTRVPSYGRDLMLHKASCDLYVCGDGQEVWRLNLEQGRFLAPLQSTSGKAGGNNCCGINPVNSLLMFGGDACVVDVWDSRNVGTCKGPSGTLDLMQVMSGTSQYALFKRNGTPQITTLRFDESDGVSFAVGTGNGFVLLFDLRSSKPLMVRDHGNGMKVHSIRLHEDGTHCISSDTKGIKVWDRTSGMNMVSIEPDANVNHLCTIGNSGVMCAAMEAPRVKTFYIPALGPAPKWCSFLDTFTEELEDGKGKGVEEQDEAEEVYENYKFVAQDELEGLGLGHLVGTDMLKAYMHGYFVHQKLYRRAVEVSEPFAYDKYRKEKAREKVEKERESRITKKKQKKVKVNQKVVEAIKAKSGKAGKKGDRALGLLQDERFKDMFSNEDFAVDEEAERYQHLNPSGDNRNVRGAAAQDVDDSDEEYLEQFELVDDVEEKGEKDDRIWSSDEDDDNDEDDDEQGSDVEDGNENAASITKRKVPRMYGLDKTAELSRRGGAGRKEGGMHQKKLREEVSLGARVHAQAKKKKAKGKR